MDRPAHQRHDDQLHPERREHLGELPRALGVAADGCAERVHPGRELYDRAALEHAGAADRAEDRHAERRHGLRRIALLAAAHERAHAADHGAAAHDAHRVAHVDRVHQPRRHRPAVDHLDALGAQCGHEAGVVRLHARHVGQLARLPEPVALGVDERASALVPAIGSHAVPLVARPAHEHGAQRAHVVVAAPVGVPVARQRAGLVEGRLGAGGEEALYLVLGRALLAHSNSCGRGGPPPADGGASPGAVADTDGPR